MMQFCTVMSCGLLPLMENTSSRPHANEQWSKIMFLPLLMPAASESWVPTAPCLTRR